jgi:hypothetical protein
MINDASFAYIIANYYAHLAAIGQASQVDPHDVAHAASAAMVVWRHLAQLIAGQDLAVAIGQDDLLASKSGSISASARTATYPSRPVTASERCGRARGSLSRAPERSSSDHSSAPV